MATPTPTPVQAPEEVEMPVQELARREITLPIEPVEDEAESLELIFRMPLSGERIRRRFYKTEQISVLYDFIDHLQNIETCKFEGVLSYTSLY